LRCEVSRLTLALALNEEDSLLAGLVVPVDAREVVEVPDQLRVLARRQICRGLAGWGLSEDQTKVPRAHFALTAGEVKAGPAVNVVGFGDLVLAVVVVDLLGQERLGPVGAHPARRERSPGRQRASLTRLVRSC
jgi:hypothetical protein